MRPKTAKLFHDPSYPCTFATELPVTGVTPRELPRLLRKPPIQEE
jgi:hypothetical protein